LESASAIKPQDVSEAAKKARVADYRDFKGIRFLARIGVEPAKGEYKAKNILTSVITPDQKEWRAIEQAEQPLMHAVPAEAKRAMQATSNGLDTEKTIQKTGLDPDPWDAGAIAAILPELSPTYR
jgi:hypothetical protein